MKPYSARRRERDKGYSDARDAALDRAHGRCEVMALECTRQAEQVHHIAGRGGPDPHRLWNLLVCCARCHERIHQSPQWARDRGYMRSRLGTVTPPVWAQEDAS